VYRVLEMRVVFPVLEKHTLLAFQNP